MSEGTGGLSITATTDQANLSQAGTASITVEVTNTGTAALEAVYITDVGRNNSVGTISGLQPGASNQIKYTVNVSANETFTFQAKSGDTTATSSPLAITVGAGAQTDTATPTPTASAEPDISMSPSLARRCSTAAPSAAVKPHWSRLSCCSSSCCCPSSLISSSP